MSPTLRSGVSVRGLAYVAFGSEQSDFAVMFVHGWCCQSADFFPVFDELTARNITYQAIAVDLPGHGKTPTATGEGPTIESFARLVMDLVVDLRLAGVVLVGHSMGHRIVLDAWSQTRSSQLVKGLVILDGSHYNLRPGLYAFDKTDTRSAALSDEEREVKLADIFRTMFTARTPISFQKAKLADLATIDRAYRDQIRQNFVQYDYRNLDNVIGAVGEAGVPLLNIQSTDLDANNKRVSLKAGQRTKFMIYCSEHVPQSREVAIEESGHFPQVDQPRWVATSIMDFVEKLQTP